MPRNLLLIEDDPGQRELLKQRLRSERMQCVDVGTFAEGVEKSQAIDFDCIILDLGLPDPELTTEHATAERIGELRGQVVVYAGSGNASLYAAVRRTGAAFVEKPGVELLIEEIWAQINYSRPGRDSQLGQQQAQRRIHNEGEIKESTMVSISLGRVIAVVGSLVVASVTITAFVLQKVGSVDANVTSIRTSLDANTSSTNKRLDAFELELKSNQAATQQRILEWTKWRWNVSRDIHELGVTTNTRTTTPNE